jgi:hypothetical protein
VVAAFAAVPTDDQETRKVAETTRDRLVDLLQEQAALQKIKIAIIKVKQEIDGRSEEGSKAAETIGLENNALIVLGGTVRLDREFYVAPFILTRFRNAFAVALAKPRSEAASLIQMLDLQKRVVRDEAGLATFVIGLASLELGRYGDSIAVLESLADSQFVCFYRGFAHLQLQQDVKAFSEFRKASELNSDYGDPWLYLALILLKHGGWDALHRGVSKRRRARSLH